MEDDERIIGLQKQLAETLAAEEFPKTESGRLWIELATTEINKAVNDICSNKYDKDHMGYLARKSDLNCYKNMLKRMTIAASPVRKQRIVEALPVEEETPTENGQ